MLYLGSILKRRNRERRLSLVTALGSVFLAVPAWSATIDPPSVTRDVRVGDVVSTTFVVKAEANEEIVSALLTEAGIATSVQISEVGGSVPYSVTISTPQEHCTPVFPSDGLEVRGTDFSGVGLIPVNTFAEAKVNLTFVDPLTVEQSSVSLNGAPGDTVQTSVSFSGGRPSYSATSTLGANVSTANGTLSYELQIPDDASGVLTDNVTLSGQATQCGGDSAMITVRIEVDPGALTASPSSVSLAGDPGETVEAGLSIGGGVKPYGASSNLGVTSVSNGTLTYELRIPENAKGGDVISDSIIITDAVGGQLTVPVEIQVKETNGGLNPITGRADLTPNERSVGAAIETICPQLAETPDLTKDQQDLLEQCTDMLANGDSAGIPNTMEQVTTEKARASTSASIEVGNQQLSNVGSRLAALRRGSVGVDFQGLSFNVDGQSVSGSQVASLASHQLSGGGASSDSPFGRWGFFLNGTFNFGEKDQTVNETGFDFDTAGITGGADYRFSDKFVAGGAIGYSNNDVDFDSDGGKLDADSWHLAGYGTYYLSDQLYIDGILEYGWHDYDSKRNIQYQIADDLDAVSRQAKADYDGSQFGGSLGAGYDFNKGAVDFGVYGRVNYIKVDVDSFQEKGAGGLGLKVDGFDATSVTTTLGGRISRVFNTNKAVLVPQARFEWEHEYDNDATQIVARFASDPFGTAFPIFADSPDRDYFRLGLGLSAVFPHGVSAFVNYDTLLDKRDWTDHLIDAGVRWEFY
ncbi:MAG: autotransporter domain-containing protein [Pseudomonadota bacterium]|nr:autotransporter domain-containing protein [Pseudomonadota bacterium]